MSEERIATLIAWHEQQIKAGALRLTGDSLACLRELLTARQTIASQAQECERLTQRALAAEKDAERYRWLRNSGDPYVFAFNPDGGRIEGESLDAVIDGGIRGA